MYRDSTSCTSMSAVSIPTPTRVPTSAPLRVVHQGAPVSRRSRRCILDLPYLIMTSVGAPCRDAAQPACWRDRLGPRCAQAVKAFGTFFSLGLKRDAEPNPTLLIRLTIRFALRQGSRGSRLGRLASSSLIVGIATMLAVITLAPQPTEERRV